MGGAAAVLVFLDSNYNGVKDPDESPAKNMLVHVDELNQTVKTDENGIALVTNLTPYRTVNLRILGESLTDPFILPAKPGVSLQPRPGKAARIQIALIRTGEIDGFVTTPSGGAGNLELQLTSHNGDSRIVKTDPYGYFLFEKVPTGVHTLRPKPDQLGTKGYSIYPVERAVEIPAGGGAESDQNFRLSP